MASARRLLHGNVVAPARQVLLLKIAVWLAGLAPVVWLAVGLARGALGANPVEKIILVEGRWTLVFLLAVLAVTPLRRLAKWNRLVQVRRLLGLFAFFHACVHFVAYAGMDQLFALAYIVEDVVERRYITAGFAGLVLMVPLAVTSTKGWIRRLGKRWQRLHRLAYVAAGLGVLHFFWKVKADTFWPSVAALVLATLLGARAVHATRRGTKRRGGVQRSRLRQGRSRQRAQDEGRHGASAAPTGRAREPLGRRAGAAAPVLTLLGLAGCAAAVGIALSGVPGAERAVEKAPARIDAVRGVANAAATVADHAATVAGPTATAADHIAENASLRFVAPSPDWQPNPQEWHEFYFTRAAYSSFGRGRGRRGAWATDYPKADRQFLTVLRRLTNLDAFAYENAVLLTDERLRRFPFLYALEVGYMNLSPEEVTGLRDYLKAGGFLVIDDFWGTQEWLWFEHQMQQVFPNRSIVDLDMAHPVFSTFYDIEEILQVPAYRRYYYGGYSERDGYVPYVKGILDDDGRLMVMINWNTDLGDAWEWAEQPDYPLDRSTFAYQMGVNMIVYAMSH